VESLPSKLKSRGRSVTIAADAGDAANPPIKATKSAQRSDARRGFAYMSRLCLHLIISLLPRWDVMVVIPASRRLGTSPSRRSVR
jgi:hypothetical protein